MKIAILADIHSNVEAFRACLDECYKRNVDEFIFLGDYVGDFANPEETMSMIYELKSNYPCTFIKGNKEDYWLNHRNNPDEIWEYGKTTSGMLAYDYDRLSEKDLSFFESMPVSRLMHYEGFPDFIVCHGSPFSANESMREDFDYIDELVDKIDCPTTICGHFHIQTEYFRRGKHVINPGSVGISLDTAQKSQFMILTGENGNWEYELISLSYDVEKAIKRMDDARLYEVAPSWYKITKHLILTGTMAHTAVIRWIFNNFYPEERPASLAVIPESYWEAAVKELNIDI